MAKQRYLHMTFFWGKNTEIIFALWPGSSAGMYALALVIILAVAFVLEWIRRTRLVRCKQVVVAGLAQTALYAVRVGLAYLLMLALMSFNGGVLLVAVLGHALGFLAFGSSVF